MNTNEFSKDFENFQKYLFKKNIEIFKIYICYDYKNNNFEYKFSISDFIMYIDMNFFIKNIFSFFKMKININDLRIIIIIDSPIKDIIDNVLFENKLNELFEYFSKNHKLTRLYLFGFKKNYLPKNIYMLSKLEGVYLNKLDTNEINGEFIKFIKFKNLKYLEINVCDNLISIEDFYSKNLEELIFINCYNLLNIPDTNYFINLKKLEIVSCHNVINENFLSKINPNINELWIDKENINKNIEVFCKYNNIELYC